jgi:hypothetical protein
VFTIPKVNVVASDEGLSVEFLGRTGIEYREGERSAFVDAEILAAGHGIAVFKNSIRSWRPPHDKDKFTAEQRERIAANIRAAIEFVRQPIEVI